ncbi:alpha/beta fold hydrolase [Pseudoalteromonas rubra]|uniref:alpha/beta fold hydrolase n=1 Tax=Pseudoalteromonas rubra TaxID=43658 RepID=UPI000F77726B|nr:alpha/beta fold hydrolase [Pseudoalteromonas rubra]
MIKQNSLYVPVGEGHQLHLRHIYHEQQSDPAVLFIHGAVENGKIFYTQSNKGLAPFLASQGYQCFVADLRGRGDSKPAISKGDTHGQTESIVEDIPAILQYITAKTGKRPQFWVAHSWGGVLLNSVFARFPQEIEHVSACVYFGTKRSLYNRHPEKLLKANLIWYTLAFWQVKKHGYLPARRLKWGSDNETRKSHAQSVQWAKRLPWVDSDDGFDYAAALKDRALPPTLHIAGVKDKALAQPIDIKKFMAESGTGIQEIVVYGRRYGHQHDYDHINMLTHSAARQDQFSDLLAWFERFGQAPSV